MNLYCVETRPKGHNIACRCPHHVGCPIEWLPLKDAWRSLDHVLTWETEDGAQRFADMNGGTVKQLSELFGPEVILPPSVTE